MSRSGGLSDSTNQRAVSAPVGGSDRRGGERIAVGRRDDPLDLDGRPQLDAAAGPLPHETLQKQPAVLRVRLPGLFVAVTRRPRPAGLAGEDDEPVEVGQDALVAHRTLAGRRCRHPVVGSEVVERGREPGTPRGQLGQAAQRHGLHPGDAGVVDEARGDTDHPLVDQGGQQLCSAGAPLLRSDGVSTSSGSDGASVGHRGSSRLVAKVWTAA